MTKMKTVLITGCSRGIGLQFVKHYVNSGWNVIATARAPEKSQELTSAGANMVLPLDISDESSVKNLVHSLTDVKSIDLLINNAGILERDLLEECGKEAMMRNFEVNCVGVLLMVQNFLSFLRSAKGEGNVPVICNMTSRMGSIEDNTSGKRYSYRASKCALNAISKSMALDLKEDGVGVMIMHPGYVITDMTSPNADITPEECVSRITALIEKFELKDTGKFWHSNGSELPW